jgi:small subunit ribosomal protein S9
MSTVTESTPFARVESGISLGTGRRKTSVARVRVKAGSGQITINGRPFEEFFRREQDRNAVLAPLNETGSRQNVDVIVRVEGGGMTGQAGACKLGIARALRKHDESVIDVLRDTHLLTRDGRMKERKKYGLRGARRGTQFSKR